MINVYIIGPPLTGKKSIINHLHSQLSTELSSLMSCVGNITFCESKLQCPKLCETSEDIIIYLADLPLAEQLKRQIFKTLAVENCFELVEYFKNNNLHYEKLYRILPPPKIQISLKNSPDVSAVSDMIVNQILHYIWDNEFIVNSCVNCFKAQDKLEISCKQQTLLELIAQIDLVLKN